MRKRLSILLATSALAAGSFQGCQSYPGKSEMQNVTLEPMNITSMSELTFDMDISELNACDRKYKVKSLAYTTIEFGVSGPGLASPVTYLYSSNSYDCEQEKLIHSFGKLPSGVPLSVSVTVRDSGAVVAHSASTVTLAANSSTTLPLVCSTDTATLAVDFKCEELCDTPLPVDPKALGLVSLYTGFGVDDQDNIYLLATDPNFVTVGGGMGRVVKIDRHNVVDPVVRLDNAGDMWCAEVDGTTLALMGAGPSGTGVFTHDLSGAVTNFNTVIGYGNINYTTNFKNNLGKPVWVYGVSYSGTPNGGNLLVKSYDMSTTYFSSTSDPTLHMKVPSASEHEAAWDGAPNNKPIWTSHSGIGTIDQNGSVAHFPVGNNFIAIAPIPGVQSKFILTKLNDPYVYIWDRSNPNALPVQLPNPLPYSSRLLKASSNGYIYASMGPSHLNYGKLDKFVINKYKFKNNDLVLVQECIRSM